MGKHHATWHPIRAFMFWLYINRGISSQTRSSYNLFPMSIPICVSLTNPSCHQMVVHVIVHLLRTYMRTNHMKSSKKFTMSCFVINIYSTSFFKTWKHSYVFLKKSHTLVSGTSRTVLGWCLETRVRSQDL
jgi:hypothetical protein